jgi:hypothetical protein
VLAHGYSDQVLSLMRPVPRSADNAAAAAYRSGALQTVMARPGTPLGAVVAPLLAADGCIGALTAEVRDGGEQSEQVQALASIFAAQLAGILGASATASSSESRTVALARSCRRPQTPAKNSCHVRANSGLAELILAPFV